MKAEKYLFNCMKVSGVSIEQVKKDIGIDVGGMEEGTYELLADEFIRLCIYLGVNPDDVMDEVIS